MKAIINRLSFAPSSGARTVHADHTGIVDDTGKRRILLPPNAKMALVIAGAIPAVPTSPTPPGSA